MRCFDEADDAGRFGGSVVAGCGPSGGIRVVLVVEDAQVSTYVEQVLDHVGFAELDGEVQAGRVAVRASVDVDFGRFEIVDHRPATVGGGEHERLPPDLVGVIAGRIAWRPSHC